MSIRKIDGVVIDADTLDGLNAELAANQIPVLDAAAKLALANLADAVCSETEADNKIAASTQVKVKLEARVNDAATGNVAYTGYGFLPTGLIILAEVINHSGFSVGSCEPALAEIQGYKKGVEISASNRIVHAGDDANAQMAKVATYDADGFTLAWTKLGAGSAADIVLHVFAFRE